MSRSLQEAELESRAELFKALGHPVRLLILNLILEKPRHGEELAAILHLNPATISHHLSLLSASGLLGSQKDQYYQTYAVLPGVLNRSLAQIIRLEQPYAIQAVDGDAYQRKVLQAFFKHGRLITIPAQLKKRQVVLEKIVQEFEPGRTYTEREVNLILLDFHDDIASLRRGLIELGLMTRSRGNYQRVGEGS